MSLIGSVLGGAGAFRLVDALKEIIEEEPASGSSTVELGRNRMAVRVSVLKSFLVHHLENEQQKSSQISSQRIRYRQVLEHSQLTKVEQSSRHVFIVSLLKKVWMEDLFERCLVECENDHRYRSKSLRQLKAQVADKYLFQLYQLREFIQAGLKNFPPKKYIDGVPLSAIMMLSDEVLHAVLSRKANALQKAPTMQFPSANYEKIKDMRARHDLLKGFRAATYEYSDFVNKDKIYKDLMLVLDTAVELYADFQADMKHLFGKSCVCDLKVKKNNGQYNVVGIRRMLVKWAESLLENDPDLLYTQPFHQFVQNKKKVFDSFYVRSGVEAVPTHEKIIGMLMDLLAQSTFLEGRKPNPNFGLFIYDLLRAKVKVQTFQKLEALLAKLQRPKGCKQYVSLLRVKNRLMTHNHDVLVNFRYGDILVAQIQMGIQPQDAQLKAEMDHRYQYKHFLYELQRSVFGPTMQLIVIYQDYFRKDISAKMFSTGKLVKWNGRGRLKGIQLTNIECPSHHKLLMISENVFSSMKELYCRFCFRSITLPLNYLYCYNCSITYCQECSEMFSKQDQQVKKNFRKPILNSKMDVLKGLRGLHLVFFHLSYSSASNLAMKFLDFINKTYALKRPRLNIVRIEVDKLPREEEEELGKMGVYRFPAFVLFKQNQPLKSTNNVQVELFGMSVYKLFEMVAVIAEGRLTKTCPNGHQLKPKVPAEYTFWRCAECFCDKVETAQEEINVCKECLYVCCSKCSYFKNEVGEWFDQFGVSYLSTSVVRPRTDLVPIELMQLCTREHLMEYTHTLPLESLQNTCSKCRTQFYFLQEVGMAVCRACHECVCSKCAQVPPTVLDRSEYANHFVQMTAQEVDPCPQCRNYFKKTYRSKSGGRLWQCSNCAKEYSNKTLHLTCYKCDINYCLDCSYRFSEKLSGLKYDLSGCKCTICSVNLQRKEVKASNLGLMFICEICSGAFYRNTIHYNCPSCQNNYCQGCLEDQIDRKRRHIKVCMLATGDSDDTSKVEQLDIVLQGDQTLNDLEVQMRKAKFIGNSERGRFKLKGFDTPEDLQRDMQVQKLPEPLRLYYYRLRAPQQKMNMESILTSKAIIYENDEQDLSRPDRTDMYIGRSLAGQEVTQPSIKSPTEKMKECCCCSLF